MRNFSIFAQKYTVLTQHSQRVRNPNASAVFAKRVKEWVTDGSVSQLNYPQHPFDKPSGRAYVGKGHGDNGSDSISISRGSTYDGCRSWTVDGDVLTLHIYEGDNYTGARQTLRGAWEFKLNFDWTNHPEFAKCIEYAWTDFIDEQFADEEHQRITAAKARISAALLDPNYQPPAK